MKKVDVKRLWQNVGVAWVLGLLIIMGVFAFWHVTPFGNHSLLISDMGTQYIPLLTAFQHALKYQAFHLYTFSQSLGSNAVPTVAYYLLSPFNLIVIFFGAAQVTTAASVIIMAKVATIAATMTWYLQRHFRTTTRMTVIFSLAFSFCGFVAINYFDFMWLDSLIILPLVAAGIDCLVRELRPGLYFGALLASIVTNYYLGYMTCLFSVLYFAYVLYGWLGHHRELALRQWVNRLSRFVITSLLSGLSAALLLVPTGLGMLQTAKQTPNPLNFHLTPEFGLEFFTQFGVGATNYTQRLGHAPSVFVSSAVGLLVLVFFVHPAFSKREKWSAAALLLSLLLAMWVRLFNTIWHLMQAPAGFPFRNVFFLSFVMVVLGFAAWQADPRLIRRRWQWGLPVVQALSMVIGARFIVVMTRLMKGRSAKLEKYYASIQQVHWQSLAIAVAYVAVTALILFGTQQVLRKWLVTGLIMTEVGGNFILTMRLTTFGNQANYERAYQTENKQMGQVNDPDGQLYRVQNDNTLINGAYADHYNNYNDGLLFNFHGVAAYNSTLNEQTRLTLKQLGLFSGNVRRVGAVGLTPVTELLLGVKNTVHLTTAGAQTTTTQGYSGMGFAAPQALRQVPMTTNALHNQEAILQALKPSKTPYFAQTTLLRDKVKRVTKVNGVKTSYPEHHRLQLRATATGPIYFWAASGDTKYSTMAVDGKRITPGMNANGTATLIKLGDFKRGQTFTVKFAATYLVAAYKTQTMSLRQAALQQALQQVRQQRLSVHTVASHFKTSIVGQVMGSSRRSELFLSLPYDTGWQVLVNGQSVKPHRLLSGLMGVPLQPGHNRIQLTYHVPGGKLGLGLSVIALVGFGFLDWCWRRKLRVSEEQRAKKA